MRKSAGHNIAMNLNRRTVFASLAALVGVTSVASFAPAQAMDPESAMMEDDCMWRAVAQNGTLVIFADGSDPDRLRWLGGGSDPDRLRWLGGEHCTPMREDPALRALVQDAATEGRLRPCEQDRRGRDIVWEVTLKGRLYACEKALDNPAQALAFRQLARRWGWSQTQQPINPRVARLILRQADFAGASFGSREPFIHDEYAGALQAGLAYPTFVVADQQGAYMTLTPTPAARRLAVGPRLGQGPDRVWVVRPNRARFHPVKDTAWGITPEAPAIA